MAIAHHFFQGLPWGEIRLEYSQRLLAMFLAGHPNHQLVFMRIWQIEPKYLLNSLREFYEENPLNITRILDVAQDLKVSRDDYVLHIPVALNMHA